MRTLRHLVRHAQARWLSCLMLVSVLLLAPVTGAVSIASQTAHSHTAPVTASSPGPLDPCGGAGMPC